MDYTGIDLKRTLLIKKIYSIHYFEYACDFTFEGESHDFWEFICVDKGEVIIQAGEQMHHMQTNDLAFHAPNEFHNVITNGTSAPNLVVISFSCDDEIMNFFRNGFFQITQTERTLLANIIAEARQCFDCRLDDPYLKVIPLKESELPGAEQLIFLYLEQFLLHLLRRYYRPSYGPSPECLKTQQLSPLEKSRKMQDTELFYAIVQYLKTHLTEHISIEQLCKIFSISRSHLQRLFRHHCNLGVIEYFSYLKIQEAKEMIRMKQLNFTQISEKLGYTSIHYFSRQFKKITGMTPSEYNASIKAISEHHTFS